MRMTKALLEEQLRSIRMDLDTERTINHQLRRELEQATVHSKASSRELIELEEKNNKLINIIENFSRWGLVQR